MLLENLILILIRNLINWKRKKGNSLEGKKLVLLVMEMLVKNYLTY